MFSHICLLGACLRAYLWCMPKSKVAIYVCVLSTSLGIYKLLCKLVIPAYT